MQPNVFTGKTQSANSKNIRTATMFSISRFQQIIKPIMHGRFQKHVRKHQADKHTKGFGCQNLLTAMVYAQLGNCNSLRTLEQAFNSNSSHHYHLNVRSIRRSTVTEALAKRDTQPFTDMLGELMSTCSKTLRRETTDLLYLLDSTPVSLKGRGFDEWTGSNGRIKGLKIHVLMNHASDCPVAQSITDAAVNDIDEHHLVQPEKGATYVFDKGYCDYNWWAGLDEAEACFVTRLKANLRDRRRVFAGVQTGRLKFGLPANAGCLLSVCFGGTALAANTQSSRTRVAV
ncbi:IS4 transposase [Neisseria sp. HSC-16F19]|nr:IS4 transposase [Neisseria sp. HSC-16F19]